MEPGTRREPHDTKAATVGFFLATAVTIATAMPSDEAIPIFHPQLLVCTKAIDQL